MFLNYILQPVEIKESKKPLKSHQLAKIAILSNDHLASANYNNSYCDSNEPATSTRMGTSTMLDWAVMEHNLLAN